MLNVNTNQVNSSIKFNQLKLSASNALDWLISNIVNNRSRKIGIRILSRFIGLSNRCKTIYIRQDTIARDIGCCRESVNRWIAYFCELGILSKAYRPMTSCLYEINPLFYKKEIRNEIYFLLRSAIFLPIALLTSIRGEIPPETDKYIFPSEYSQGEMSHKESVRKSINTTPLSPHDASRGSERGREGDKPPGRGRAIPMETVKGPKELKLNRVGELLLSVYPPQARKHAGKVVSECTMAIKLPFFYYRKLCNDWCKANNFKIAKVKFREMHDTIRAERLDSNANGVDPKDPWIYLTPKPLGRTSDNRPPTGPLSNAVVPVLKPKLEHDAVADTKSKMEEFASSRGDGMLSSILESMISLMVKANTKI